MFEMVDGYCFCALSSHEKRVVVGWMMDCEKLAEIIGLECKLKRQDDVQRKIGAQV